MINDSVLELLFRPPKDTPLAMAMQIESNPKRLRSASDVLDESRDREHKKHKENRGSQKNKEESEAQRIKAKTVIIDLTKDDDIEHQLLAS